MVICVNCKHTFQELDNIDSDEETACPICGGSLSPLFTLYASGNMAPSGRFIGQKDAIDKTEAIRVADSQRRSSSADLNTDGTLSYTIEGPSPKNEDDSIDACRILIERLNELGERWGPPSKPDDQNSDVDCESSDGTQKLDIQVVRITNQSIWKRLGDSGSVEVSATVESAVEDLRISVRHKEKNISTPAQRADILLAINAMDTPGHALKAIVALFRQRYGAEVRQLGFQAIWIVGPLASLTKQLDVEEVLS